jgi:hypothetical protein
MVDNREFTVCVYFTRMQGKYILLYFARTYEKHSFLTFSSVKQERYIVRQKGIIFLFSNVNRELADFTVNIPGLFVNEP